MSIQQDTNWYRIPRTAKSTGSAASIHAMLATNGIHVDLQKLQYAASIIFGAGLDHFQCGYCRHPAEQHTWGLAPTPDGTLGVDHFNCLECARLKNTSLVVCYTRPGGGFGHDSY